MGRTHLVRDLLKERQPDLTAAERRLTAVLLDSTMVAGLGSIAKLAESAGVSAPTVIRLARKIGFEGYTDLQDAIREDIAARIRQPLAKLAPPVQGAPVDHILSRFAGAAFANINRTLDRLDLAECDGAAAVRSDPDSRLYFLGGRITRSNAHYMFNHLQIIRPNVQMMDSSPSVWPQTLLDMDAHSVVVVFDIRRYEKGLEKLVALAKNQGARVILFTDVWGSPIERCAAFTMRAAVEAPSSWDSTLAINFLAEALIAEVQGRRSEVSAARISALEEAIGESKIFRGEEGR